MLFLTPNTFYDTLYIRLIKDPTYYSQPFYPFNAVCLLRRSKMSNIIKNVSELLLEMEKRGIGEIQSFFNIQHGPMIGEMYEGLTKELAEKALFEGLNLKVVSGKITNSAGQLSNQIDCMIVIGEGEKLPFTNEFVYNINNVIMVIEVKKNLFSKELSDGYVNLRSVAETQANNYRKLKGKAIKSAFSSIVGKPLENYESISNLDYQEQMLYHILLDEELLPIRVLFGYSGFSNEITLRSKFINFLSQHISTKDNPQTGFGPQLFPNLIIAGAYSLIKTNGMPYSAKLMNVEGFCWLASYRRNPILLLLELLWTRLSYQYDLPSDVFGDELQNESLAPLLTINAVEGYKGWNYTYFDLSQNRINEIDKEESTWRPTSLSINEYVLLLKLCNGGTVTVIDLEKAVGNADESKNIIDNLSWSNLIYIENDSIKLLANNCKLLIDPQYGYMAADDSDGRLTNWLSRRLKDSNQHEVQTSYPEKQI